MAWGGISLKGKTPLFCFTNIMDGPFYVSILQTQLLPSAQNMYRRNWILQQDNDPKHTSHIAKDFIAENQIHALDWPSNSPDLNPIENVNELTQFLTEEWDAIPQMIVNNLVLSMKTRCELILEKNGNRISY